MTSPTPSTWWNKYFLGGDAATKQLLCLINEGLFVRVLLQCMKKCATNSVNFTILCIEEQDNRFWSEVTRMNYTKLPKASKLQYPAVTEVLKKAIHAQFEYLDSIATPGESMTDIQEFAKYTADQLLQAIDLPVMYGSLNPFAKNFFESMPTIVEDNEDTLVC